MKQGEAKQIVEQALNQAFVKGAFNLQDATMITEALKVLFLQPEVELVQEN